MHKFRFPKTKKRNNFTKIFGGAGKRRFIQQLKSHIPRPLDRIIHWTHIYLSGQKHRTKMQKIRRSHQGWRNKTFGTIQALKIRLQYGRRRPTPQFRR